MPTLEEFIAALDTTAIRNTPIRIPELGARLMYPRRVRGTAVELVDLPPMRGSDGLTRRAIEDLCRRAVYSPKTSGCSSSQGYCPCAGPVARFRGTVVPFAQGSRSFAQRSRR